MICLSCEQEIGLGKRVFVIPFPDYAPDAFLFAHPDCMPTLEGKEGILDGFYVEGGSRVFISRETIEAMRVQYQKERGGTMSKVMPIWEGFALEHPGQILEFLALEGVNRLVESAYREPLHEYEEKLQSMVSPEAWQVFLTLSHLEGEYGVNSRETLCKLIPALMRTLEIHNLLTTTSWEEILEAAVAEAGLSPMQRGDIVALQRLKPEG